MRIHYLAPGIHDECLRREGHVHGPLQILVPVEHAVELPAVSLDHGFRPCNETGVIHRYGNDVEVYLLQPVLHYGIKSIQFGNARLAGHTPERDDHRLACDNGPDADLFTGHVLHFHIRQCLGRKKKAAPKNNAATAIMNLFMFLSFKTEPIRNNPDRPQTTTYKLKTKSSAITEVQAGNCIHFANLGRDIVLADLTISVAAGAVRTEATATAVPVS